LKKGIDLKMKKTEKLSRFNPNQSKNVSLFMDSSIAEYLEYMIHGFYNGLQVLCELGGLSNDELETIYALGYNYFTYGKYQNAKEIFNMLASYAPYTAHYWRALGAVNQQMENYREAIAAYDLAIATDELDIVSRLYRGESRLLSGYFDEAIEDFKDIIEITVDKPNFSDWSKRAELLLSLHKLK